MTLGPGHGPSQIGKTWAYFHDSQEPDSVCYCPIETDRKT